MTTPILIQTMKIPVDFRVEEEDDPRRGLITYRYNEPTEPRGLFSFTWYGHTIDPISSSQSWYNDQLHYLLKYLRGIKLYIDIVSNYPEFEGWKVVVYTDETSLQQFYTLIESSKYKSWYAKQNLGDIFNHEKVILATCKWSEYALDTRSTLVDGSILRIFRNRAFCDFNVIPVLVRDADTIFDKGESITFIKNWEHTLLNLHKATGKPFLVSSQLGYHREWHKNTKTNFPSMGFFAGITNKLAPLPQWEPTNPENLWLKGIDFIRQRSQKILENDVWLLSNAKLDSRGRYINPSYIGKDEQVIFFVWLPELLEQTFFFYYGLDPVLYDKASLHNYNSMYINEYPHQIFETKLKGVTNTIIGNLKESRPTRFNPEEPITSIKDKLYLSYNTHRKIEDLSQKLLNKLKTEHNAKAIPEALTEKENVKQGKFVIKPQYFPEEANAVRYPELINELKAEGILNSSFNYNTMRAHYKTRKNHKYNYPENSNNYGKNNRIELKDDLLPHKALHPNSIFYVIEAFRDPIHELVLRNIYKKLYGNYVEKTSKSSNTMNKPYNSPRTNKAQGGRRKRLNKTRKH